MSKLVIYPADIINIIKRSDRHCRNIFVKIRALNNKQKHQAVTLDEFCNYMGLKKEEVEKEIK